MSEHPEKNFDCVAYMRQARDTLSAEMSDMPYDDLVKWLRSHEYSDPVLERLSKHAVEPNGQSADRPTR